MADERLLATALEISQKRAEMMRKMRAAILTNDLHSALQTACQLVGLSENEAAPHLELLAARLPQSCDWSPGTPVLYSPFKSADVESGGV